MRTKQRALVVTVLLTAGCAKINFLGSLPRAFRPASTVASEPSFDHARFELGQLARETKTLGTNLTDAFGLYVLEPANNFWALELDWSRYDESDRAMIGLILDRIVKIAERRAEITGGGRAWEDQAPATRARNLRAGLKAFEERLAQADIYRF